MNLSDRTLNENECNVLEKGLAFAPVQRKIPTMGVTASVESALKSCKKVEEAEVARSKIASAISRAGHRHWVEWRICLGIRELPCGN